MEHERTRERIASLISELEIQQAAIRDLLEQTEALLRKASERVVLLPGVRAAERRPRRTPEPRSDGRSSRRRAPDYDGR